MLERDTLQETQIAGSQVATTSAKQQLQRQLTDREGTQAPCCGSRNKWSFPKQVVLAVAGHIEHKNLCYKSTAMSICMLYIDTCTSCHMTEIQYDPTASKKQLHEMLAPCWNVTHCKNTNRRQSSCNHFGEAAAAATAYGSRGDPSPLLRTQKQMELSEAGRSRRCWPHRTQELMLQEHSYVHLYVIYRHVHIMSYD